MNNEVIKVVFENDRLRVEEISSFGGISTTDFWYNNPIDEWVSVTNGHAILQFEDEEVVLKSGQSYYIKSNIKHRVKFTTDDCQWLCVYIK